jgi:hypothetical protein
VAGRYAAGSGRLWDLSSYAEIALDIKNVGTNPVTVFCQVDNPGADGIQHCVTGSLDLRPGQTGGLNVPLKRTSEDKLDGKLFGMRGYPTTARRSVPRGKWTFTHQPAARSIKGRRNVS